MLYSVSINITLPHAGIVSKIYLKYVASMCGNLGTLWYWMHFKEGVTDDGSAIGGG